MYFSFKMLMWAFTYLQTWYCLFKRRCLSCMYKLQVKKTLQWDTDSQITSTRCGSMDSLWVNEACVLFTLVTVMSYTVCLGQANFPCTYSVMGALFIRPLLLAQSWQILLCFPPGLCGHLPGLDGPIEKGDSWETELLSAWAAWALQAFF